MTRRKKHGQQVIPPKRSTRTDDVAGLVSVTEVTPDNVEEILGRFFTGPGIDGSIAAEGPMIDDDQLLRPVEFGGSVTDQVIPDGQVGHGRWGSGELSRGQPLIVEVEHDRVVVLQFEMERR